MIAELEKKLSESENEQINMRKNELILRNKLLKNETQMSQIKLENEFLLKKPVEFINFSNLAKINVILI